MRKTRDHNTIASTPVPTPVPEPPPPGTPVLVTLMAWGLAHSCLPGPGHGLILFPSSQHLYAPLGPGKDETGLGGHYLILCPVPMPRGSWIV